MLCPMAILSCLKDRASLRQSGERDPSSGCGSGGVRDIELQRLGFDGGSGPCLSALEHLQHDCEESAVVTRLRQGPRALAWCHQPAGLFRSECEMVRMYHEVCRWHVHWPVMGRAASGTASSPFLMQISSEVACAPWVSSMHTSFASRVDFESLLLELFSVYRVGSGPTFASVDPGINAK